MNHTKRVLSTLALSILGAAIIGGCGSSQAEKLETGMGNVAMALSTTVSTPGGDVYYCMTGDIVYTGTDPVRDPVTVTNDSCDNTPIPQGLPPGIYEATMPDVTCTVDNATPADYLGCELLPTPVEFEIGLGVTTNVELSFRLNFLNRVTDVLTGIGAGNFVFGEAVDRELCGTDDASEVCEDTEICATLDVNATPDTYACYAVCTTDDDTVLNAGDCDDGDSDTNEMCVPVSGVDDENLVNVGLPDGLNAVPHVCSIVP